MDCFMLCNDIRFYNLCSFVLSVFIVEIQNGNAHKILILKKRQKMSLFNHYNKLLFHLFNNSNQFFSNVKDIDDVKEKK